MLTGIYSLNKRNVKDSLFQEALGSLFLKFTLPICLLGFLMVDERFQEMYQLSHVQFI